VRRLLYSIIFILGFMATLLLGLMAVGRASELLGLSSISHVVIVALVASAVSWLMLSFSRQRLATINHALVSKLLSVFFGAGALLAGGMAALTAFMMVRSGYGAREIDTIISTWLLALSICIGPAVVACLTTRHLTKIANQ